MEKKQFEKPDAAEQARTLTEAEQRRMDRFEALAQLMAEQGYERVDLTVGLIGANLFAIVLLIPLLIIGFFLYFLAGRGSFSLFGDNVFGFLLFLVVFFALIVVHELVHGISWAVFAENHWKDIEFGFIRKYLTPYCTCADPLTKGQYIFGAVMPLITLGILPMAAGILFGSLPVLLMGIIMTDSAAGDILIVWRILRYPSKGKDIVYVDHPTQAGGVIFEKKKDGV